MNKSNGITLIALVITIIVLLILVGVTIVLMIGENGILSQATKAEEETRYATIREEKGLWQISKKINKSTGEKATEEASDVIVKLYNNGTITEEEKEQLISGKSIKIGEKEILFEMFSLVCSKPTIKVNTNAVIYLKCNFKITSNQIMAYENGKAVEFSYEPTCTESEEGIYTWKLYIKPTELGIHNYTISIGDDDRNIEIKAAKTVFSR